MTVSMASPVYVASVQRGTLQAGDILFNCNYCFMARLVSQTRGAGNITYRIDSQVDGSLLRCVYRNEPFGF